MHIDKLVLKGYKRLLLNNTQKLAVTTTNSIQLILGTNGSGKSSVLEELSPLPANPSDYVRPGMKHIQLRDGQENEYTLVSHLKKSSNKHSFVRNGEELNPGGTAAVQKTLVWQHFRYSEALHRFFTDKTTFTNMSPAKRREWITMLSDTDMSYALDVFQRIKTLHRDNVGAMKHINQRLSNESSKLLGAEEVDALKKRTDQLRAELTVLMESKNPPTHAREDLKSRLRANMDELERHCRAVINTPINKPAQLDLPAREHYQELEEEIQRLKSEYATADSLLKHYTDEYNEIERLLHTLDEQGSQGIEDLQQKLTELQQREKQIHGQIQRFVIEEEPTVVRQSTDSALPLLVMIFNELPDNSDRTYSRQRMDAAKDQHKKISEAIERLNNRMAQTERRVDNIEQAKEQQCPKCNYIWKPGVSEKELETLKSYSKELSDEVEEKEQQLLSINDYIDRAENYAATYRRFRSLVDSHPRLKPLWDYLLENNCLTNDPSSATPIVYQWKADVEQSCLLEEVREEIRSITAALGQIDKIPQNNNEHFGQRAKRLVEEIENATSTLDAIRVRQRKLTQYQDQLNKIVTHMKTAKSLIEQVETNRDRYVELVRGEHIDNVINSHQNSLAIAEKQLTERSSVEAVIEDLERDANKTNEVVSAYRLLQEELSPSHGLIADQLFGFIHCLVDQLNAVIEQIWTYKLQVQPCGLDSGELDYKFPLDVADGTTDAKDVGDGSTAQKEIINFAFKLVTMLYLEKMDMPLYLDEFGSCFDIQHRQNAMNFVKQLVDTSRCSQLFMISHYASSYGAFTNAEVCVLDATNISAPQGHNQHVELD